MELKVNNFNGVTQRDLKSETHSWSFETIIEAHYEGKKMQWLKESV